jgi:hypothetical protein
MFLVNVRCSPKNELKSDIAPCLKGAKTGSRRLRGALRIPLCHSTVKSLWLNCPRRRRSHAPILKKFVGGKAPQGRAASPSQMGR